MALLMSPSALGEFVLVCLAVAVTGTATVFIEVMSGRFGIPAPWIIGILVTILIAVLGAFGAILKIAYDTAMKWEAVLEGASEDVPGFVSNTRDHQDDMEDTQDQLYEQLLVQGQLLSELTYAFADIAEELNKSDNLEVNVDLAHIERLQEERERK